ncbi:hypothetical protein ACFFLS_14260 [Flavobacterium procerum]|uniref:Thymidylate kinase n=1 Tax=Flavobacterium procerum TaxID=1455569 RepID=A0ABV6BRZ8_9FLAO
MIRTILITGLDGCGKSTLFLKLKSDRPEHAVLVNLPHIDEDALPAGGALKKQAGLLNQMSSEADENGWADLKALALFGSMMLYEKLVCEIITPRTRIVICERHPLIDTLVYAKFYAQRITPEYFNRKRLDHYNNAYGELLAFIAELLPIENKADPVMGIFNFIRNFFKDTTVPDENIKALFKATLPNKVFFLKADPEILFERIASRNVSEPHEKLEVLELFDNAYDALFENISQSYRISVEYIDASHFKNLDRFYARLKNEITNLH